MLWRFGNVNFRSEKIMYYVNPRRHEEKQVTRRHGGESIGPPPSIFKSIQPIHMKLGMCNKCPVYFKLSIVTWYPVGFHGNRSIEMTFLSVIILFFNDIHSINTKSIQKLCTCNKCPIIFQIITVTWSLWSSTSIMMGEGGGQQNCRHQNVANG